ncbi:Dabb family protein [Seramator thermalis]|uniref:Dabb family protein n=1 Tax=Seramator thermalis TaxID=2496270 RepID=UPI00101D065B|nr:Dabb family protein [Seramator thermalis]MBP9031137.1 Dabb family protein [Dysgonamonadaceae bacterium]MDK2837785.1 hypothetical protein [Bacteroidota bacterium]HQI44025.1 Dabb family protein [Dysgonamonadaceae bacterium]
MIKHIVMFRLADEANGRNKRENALIIKKQLEALKDIIPQIMEIDVYLNDENASPDNYDIILDSKFASPDDLKIYSNHPEHLKVAAFIAGVRTGRAAIDYEI